MLLHRLKIASGLVRRGVSVHYVAQINNHRNIMDIPTYSAPISPSCHDSLTLTSIPKDQRHCDGILGAVFTMSNGPLEPAQNPLAIALSG